MHTRKLIKLVTPIAACCALLVSFALPAGAATSNFSVEAIASTLTVGSFAFPTPSGTTPVCPGSTSISGTIDDTAGTIDGTLNITTGEFKDPILGGDYQLTATGTATTGTYSSGTQTFTGLDFGTIAFSIKSINTSDCTTGSVACSGTASISTHGAILGSASPPLNTGDQVGVLGSGSITQVSTCTFPWSLVIGSGTSLSLGPNSSAPPYNATWAVFEQ